MFQNKIAKFITKKTQDKRTKKYNRIKQRASSGKKTVKDTEAAKTIFQSVILYLLS